MLSLFRPKVNPVVPLLHAAIVQASRRPEFYISGQVPDTVDGRFELLALHAFLVLRRLRGWQEPLAQQLFDAIFAQLDLNLRELGVGDMGVGKRIKHMGQSFYGRLSAYEKGLKDDAAMHDALSRNLFGTLLEAPASTLTAPIATYLHTACRHLDNLPEASILSGQIDFPAFPVSAA
jgi:cytochrome b pre-mRNA-processing protein 3